MQGYPVRILNDYFNVNSTIIYNGSNVSSNNKFPVSLGNDIIRTTVINNGANVTLANPFPVTLGDGVITVTACNLIIPAVITVDSSPSDPVHVHIEQQIPTGSNTIGNVGINGIIPVTLCNLPIPMYLTQQLPTGSNTIGNVGINVNTSNVSLTNPFPVTITNPVSIGTYSSNGDLKVSAGDYTSKNALKVSTPETIFFNTFQYGIETDIWDIYTSNGGSIAFSPDISGVTMQITNQINSTVVRQTKHVMKYIPGRMSELTFAIRFTTPVAGIRRRIGLFDGNDGFYFEDNGGDYACVFISSDSGVPYMERVSRANWNGDKLDGLGSSKLTADPEAQQIVSFEYEWYGGGQIIFKYIINGKSIVIHTFNTANRLRFPWCKTPFLPIRLEIVNVTGVNGTFVMYQGSNSLTSQGTTSKLGVLQSVLTSLDGYNMQLAKIFYAVINIRLKPTALQGVVLPSYFQVGTVDNTAVFYKLIRNATITGGNWVDMPDPNSFVQYNITSQTQITDGINLDTGFISSSTGGMRIEIDKSTHYQLGRSNMGQTSDILTLAIAGFGTNKDAIASFTWIEHR